MTWFDWLIVAVLVYVWLGLAVSRLLGRSHLYAFTCKVSGRDRPLLTWIALNVYIWPYLLWLTITGQMNKPDETNAD